MLQVLRGLQVQREHQEFRVSKVLKESVENADSRETPEPKVLLVLRAQRVIPEPPAPKVQRALEAIRATLVSKV